MEMVRVFRSTCGMLLLCMLLLSLPLSAQFRAAASRDDFHRLEVLGAGEDKDAYELQYEKVVADARKRGDWNSLFDALGNKAAFYLRLSDVKTNAAVLSELKRMAETSKSDYGMMDYYLARAMSLTAQMLPEEALKMLDNAIAISEKHPGEELFNSSYAYSQKGQAYLIYPKYDEAIAEIETAVKKAGENKLFQRNPRISLFRLYVANDSHLEEAREHMEWLQRNFPLEEMNHYERETFQFSSVLYLLYLKDTENAQKVVNQMDYNIIRIDCQRRIYECNKDYVKAIEVFRQYMQENDSVVAELVEMQMSQYDSELAARELDIANARLSQANHQLELEQSQRASRILDLKQESHNQRLQTLKLQLEMERQQQELESLQGEKENREARMVQEKRLARNKFLGRIVIFMAILLVMAIVFGLLMLWGIRVFRKQKKIAEQAAQHAQEANLMKSRFLQNMNHDLRAPLAAIVSIVDLLNTPGIEIGQEEKDELMEGMRMQSDLLLQLVDDIIDLSALQSGEYHLEYSEVDLGKLCTSAIMGFKGRCAEGVEMLLDLPDKETIIRTDSKRLLEVLGNLLGNAAKYTEKGNIVLSYREGAEEVEFSVTDTGTGIPESQAATIFDRFEKIGSIKKGFGLGLSICLSVVTLMKGRIWLDTAYKQGARFCFTLPKALILFFLMGATAVSAQDNPYRIDNKAFEYMGRYMANQAKAEAVSYIDTMMMCARAANDVKGQCVAMNLYTEYKYVTNADIQQIRQAKDRCVAFCRKTPYTQYAFSAWSYLVLHLQEKGLYMQVLKELKDFDATAVELGSVYGKSNCLMYLGRTYERLRQYGKADEAYKNAIRVCQESGDTINIAAFYHGYGNCLNKMGRYGQSLRQYEAGLRACRLPQMKVAILLSKADCLYGLKDADAMEETLRQIDSLAKENVISTVNQIVYSNIKAKYYVLRGDAAAAQALVDGIPEENVNSDLRRDLLILRGDMAGAFQKMVEQAQKNGDENQRILGLQFQEFNLTLENTEKELEQEKLRLRNTDMMLQNSLQEQKLLALENESDSLRILETHISLEAQESERQLRRQHEAEREADLQQAVMREKQRSHMNAVLLAMLLFGLMAGVFALRRLWNVWKDIVRERQAALKSQREAEQADEDMSLFMHSMNHEIRTPLNAIIGFTEILNQADGQMLDEAERNQLVESLHEHTQNIQLMVNTILDISKMESGTYVFNQEPTMLFVLAEQALEQIRSKVGEGVELVNKTEMEEKLYMLDSNRMLTVLTNLLVNAARSTKHGSISLHMQCRDGLLHIDVEDTGCGIPEEIKSRIYERFTKADPFAEGFGLGLPLCRAIVEKMDGKIWLEKSDGNGTHFVVEMPCEEESIE